MLRSLLAKPATHAVRVSRPAVAMATVSFPCPFLFRSWALTLPVINQRSFVFPAGQREFLNEHLEKNDPEMFNIIEGEKKRQRESVCLIPSEVCRGEESTKGGRVADQGVGNPSAEFHLACCDGRPG